MQDLQHEEALEQQVVTAATEARVAIGKTLHFGAVVDSTLAAFKRLKDKVASQLQLFIGFWWDSFEGTRALEERKLVQYLDVLLLFSKRKSLTLNERQRVAGYMERAVKTMPPGASCLLANVFLLMVGLSLAWQKRRTTRKEREDYRFFYDVLNSNLGKGYYTTDRFQEGPTVYSDASRSSRYSGGGWCSSWGPFDYWRYGTAASKKPIDFLEGDTMICSVESQGPTWKGKIVRYNMDNQAFQKSAVKGRSRAERLTRTRSVRNAALIVLEKPMALNPIRMETNLEAPSQPLLHELGVLPPHEAQSDGLPHVSHERLHADTHARQGACPLIIHDPRPGEHLGEGARHVRLLMPAHRQAIHVGARTPVERHSVRAERRGQLT